MHGRTYAGRDFGLRELKKPPPPRNKSGETKKQGRPVLGRPFAINKTLAGPSAFGVRMTRVKRQDKKEVPAQRWA